ncbi:hypothetical protein CJU90_4447 [Yarrowia sp. C11]|nr:hypothetical protein CJU90_4447 [Yarrowia sp. C11]
MCETCHQRKLDSRFLPPQRCLLCQKLVDGCQYRRHLIACNQRLRQIENEVIKSRPMKDEQMAPPPAAAGAHVYDEGSYGVAI